MALSRCQFNPAGIESVRSQLGQGGISDVYQRQLHAAAYAFLSCGFHKDGHHSLNAKQFHDLFKVARANLPTGKEGRDARTAFYNGLLDTIFDLVTAYDRVTGGATLVITFSGAQAPGAQPVPSHVKTQVYFNPGLLEEMPDMGPALARMNQIFAEEIALRIIPRWERAFKSAGYSYDFCTTAVLPIVAHPLVPAPVRPNCARYHFHGHPPEEFQAILEAEGGLEAEQPLGDVRNLNQLEMLRRRVRELEEVIHEADIDHTRSRIKELENVIEQKDLAVKQLEEEVRQLHSSAAMAAHSPRRIISLRLSRKAGPPSSIATAVPSITMAMSGKGSGAHTPPSSPSLSSISSVSSIPALMSSGYDPPCLNPSSRTSML
ncbi:hypothetical protein A0H81_12570 [Grifola frondosa]|uniref:Uncharacterized protein n=1 Tax=Grifola frondosa TaxID=5627 RepID=A0A1C7LX93_GRIFR|nr:hypothetical protein A0H81_12570 [Grifola frondosa]